MTRKPKLELTWIGKDDRPRLEPRILIEEPALSHHAASAREGAIYDNMLIQGDNLLALKALEADYAGKVKCVYIDPPFNTQQALEHYNDGLEHSIWLSLLRDRLELIRILLSDDGSIFIHIDDNELGYLVVLMDELFGRANRVNIATFKQGAATGHKAINPGLVSTSNFILLYAKDKSKWIPNRVFAAKFERDTRYNQFIENVEAPHDEWTFTTLARAVARSVGVNERELKKTLGEKFEAVVSDFVISNARSVIRFARPDYKAVSAAAREKIDESIADPEAVVRLERDAKSTMFFRKGERVLFYADKLKMIDGELVAGEPLTTIWDDLLSNNLHNEGGVSFPKGKKPEALIKRCLELTTKPGDLVLDSFGGSGTTGAVAHKMGRRWIMAELGEHATTHIVPRLASVIDGTDASGVTAATSWLGGGGYRFFRLAPSLLSEDKYGNWVISKDYNPEMLAEALCKHMGYAYGPSQSEDEYWMHGQSTETDFIYVTTQQLTQDACRKIADDVGPDRSLLICCKAFSAIPDSFPNLTLVKIPTAILKKCEWGRDDYSLAIQDLPPADDVPEDAPPSSNRMPARKKVAAPSLFDEEGAP